MSNRLITGPAELPVTVALAKASVRVLHAAEDTLIETYIEATTDKLDGPDGRLGRCIIAQTWEVTFDGFPAGDFVLPFGPVQSLESVTYRDVSGQTQTLSSSVYELVPDTADRAYVRAIDSWPVGTKVAIRFVAGYADDADSVPQAIRLAILMWCGEFYRNREAQSPQALSENPAIWSLLTKYMRISV